MARRTYTAAEKAEALALYEAEGLAVAARRTGIAKGTIASWAHRTGAQSNALQMAERTRTAAAARMASVEERRAAMAERLLRIAELGLDVEELTLTSGEELALRDVVGARTRAIHDFQLLTGAATSRTETITTATLDDEIERLMDAAEHDGAHDRHADAAA